MRENRLQHHLLGVTRPGGYQLQGRPYNLIRSGPMSTFSGESRGRMYIPAALPRSGSAQSEPHRPEQLLAAGRGRPGPGRGRGRAVPAAPPPPPLGLGPARGRWRAGERHGAGLGVEADVVAVLPVPAGHRALHAGALGAHRLQYPSAGRAWPGGCECGAGAAPLSVALCPAAAPELARGRRAGVAAPRALCGARGAPGPGSCCRRGLLGAAESRAGRGVGPGRAGGSRPEAPSAAGGAAASAWDRGLNSPCLRGLSSSP